MIITKPSNIYLSPKDVKNLCNTNQNTKINLSYSAKDNENISYIECGRKIDYFYEIVEYLNQINAAALIDIDEWDINKNLYPYHITPKIAVSLQGFYQKGEKVLSTLSEILSNKEYPINESIILDSSLTSWMLSRIGHNNGILILLKSDGSFQYIGKSHKDDNLIQNGITYYAYNIISRIPVKVIPKYIPSTPPPLPGIPKLYLPLN